MLWPQLPTLVQTAVREIVKDMGVRSNGSPFSLLGISSTLKEGQVEGPNGIKAQPSYLLKAITDTLGEQVGYPEAAIRDHIRKYALSQQPCRNPKRT